MSFLIIALALAFLFPHIARPLGTFLLYVVAVPVFGTAVGGFSWAVASMLWPVLITITWFGCFLAGGCFGTLGIAVMINND